MTLLTPDLLESKTYPFQKLRRVNEHLGLQEGVYGASDFKVVQRAAGAGPSVDIGMGAAWVKGDTGTRQGHYHVENDATVNLSVGAGNQTNPRVDQVILTVFDSVVAGTSDVPTLTVLAGAATAGATLDNRTGVAPLPNDAIRLADILVPAASTSVTTSNIRDRRPRATGFLKRIQRVAQAAGPIDYPTSSGTPVQVDPTVLSRRVESNGVSLFAVTLRGHFTHTVAAGRGLLQIYVDGAAMSPTQTHTLLGPNVSTNNVPLAFTAVFLFVLPTGSHTFVPMLQTLDGGTVTVQAQQTIPFDMLIEEKVSQDGDNT